jgi:hypothetical protein
MGQNNKIDEYSDEGPELTGTISIKNRFDLIIQWNFIQQFCLRHGKLSFGECAGGEDVDDLVQLVVHDSHASIIAHSGLLCNLLCSTSHRLRLQASDRLDALPQLPYNPSMSTSSPSLVQLRQAIEIHEQIQKLEAELRAILGGIDSSGGGKSGPAAPDEAPKTRGRKKRKKLSAESRARMAAAAKARWAKKG